MRDDVMEWPHELDEPFFRELQYCEWQTQIDGMLVYAARVHTTFSKTQRAHACAHSGRAAIRACGSIGNVFNVFRRRYSTE
jgi:hypothetical protein